MDPNVFGLFWAGRLFSLPFAVICYGILEGWVGFQDFRRLPGWILEPPQFAPVLCGGAETGCV